MYIPGLENLRENLSRETKKGADFVCAAGITWTAIMLIWLSPFPIYNKCVFSFFAGGMMLPLAGLFSKIFKTNWKVKNNPLQPLGLWLNFAQLFYFPILILLLLRSPEYFIAAYAIITAAHLFPYAWLYGEIAYAVMAGLLSAGALIISLSVTPACLYLIPLCMSVGLLLLAIIIYINIKKQQL